MKYNILTEKWIPMSDGQKYALLECLEHAHELERISCSSPLETYALHRFLCAFVMDALQLPNKAARMALLKQGRFEMSIFESYIKMCEEEGVSFDLFDAKRPFMQAEYNPQFDKDTKNVSCMLLNVPSGTNHIFFEHKHEDEHRLTIDDAFRSMLALFAFCPAGGAGYSKSVNGEPCLYAVVLGDSLFDTLLNNIISIKEAGNLPYGLPCWRDMTTRIPKEEIASIELLQGLTWQPRRVNLISTPDGLVEKIFFTTGRKTPSSPLWRDPHVPYQKKDGAYFPILPKKGRSLWRDLGGMTLSKEDRFGRQPQVIAALQSNSSIYKIAVTGLITNGNAKLIDVMYEEAVLPYKVLNVMEYGEEFRHALQFVEDIYTIILNESVKKKLIIKKGTKRTIKTIVTDAINEFFATTKDYLLGTYLKALIVCDSDEEFVQQRVLLEQWLRKELTNTIDQLLLRLGIDGHNLQRISEFKENVLHNFNKKLRSF